MAALESYVKSLSSEIKCRSALVTNMDHGQTFYANQRGEVKVVVNVSAVIFMFNQFITLCIYGTFVIMCKMSNVSKLIVFVRRLTKILETE